MVDRLSSVRGTASGSESVVGIPSRHSGAERGG